MSMMMSAPRPVSTPPTEVASLRQVSNSRCLALMKDGAR